MKSYLVNPLEIGMLMWLGRSQAKARNDSEFGLACGSGLGFLTEAKSQCFVYEHQQKIKLISGFLEFLGFLKPGNTETRKYGNTENSSETPRKIASIYTTNYGVGSFQ